MENAQALVNKLIALNYCISFAESCTGGMLCSRIVDVPDASKVLNMSFITYADAAKIKLLGVNSETIAEHGVVSEQVAGQMAHGAAKVSGANVAVGVSGIAGPSGGTAQKPVGTVCFGFYINGGLQTFTEHFSGLDRQGVRNASCDFVLKTLLSLIK